MCCYHIKTAVWLQMETSNEFYKTTTKPAKNKRNLHIAKNSRMAWTEKDHVRKIKSQFMKNIISGNLVGGWGQGGSVARERKGAERKALLGANRVTLKANRKQAEHLQHRCASTPIASRILFGLERIE